MPSDSNVGAVEARRLKRDPEMKVIKDSIIVLAVLLIAYAVVVDDPARMVIMSRAEFDRALVQARIKAAQEAMAAVEIHPGAVCTWQDLFNQTRKINAKN